MELSYANNPKSLFRKYAKLVTWYGRQSNSDIALYLPNGHIERNGGSYRMVVSTAAVNAPRLLPILQTIDALNYRLESFREACDVLAWYLEGGRMPSILNRMHLSQLVKNPDANPETTTVDGRVGRQVSNESWTTKHDSAGESAADTTSSLDAPQLIASTSAGSPWSELWRMVTLFDTSALTSAAVLAATSKVSLYITSTVVTLGSQSYRWVTCTPASNTALVAADYNLANWGATAQGTDATLAGITGNAYNDTTLNSTGLASVSLTGITKFGMRLVSDAANAEPTWSSGAIARITGTQADAGSNKPKLTIDYDVSNTSGLFSGL